MKHLLLLLFITFYFEVRCDRNKEVEEEDFIATHEWQTIKKGQKVPQGLHYRINLETGLNEAKLLDEKSNEKKDLLEVSSPNEGHYASIDEIKKVLKNIKGDDIKAPIKRNSKFRTYEQLKEEMGVLNLTSKVDSEIIRDLLKRHQEEVKNDKINADIIINILEDFEYLAHQFDNGLEFVNQNGFRDVIYKNLNCSSDKIKEGTLRLFGSLLQNNARVQIHALETGSLPILLRFLNPEVSSEQTKSNALFALGCLLRRFPLAQQTFIENGGLYVILQLFESSLKIRLKIVTLLTDLLTEKRQAEDNSNQLLISQYKLVNLESQLLEQNWCLHIDKLLANIVDTYPEDYDSIEKVIIAMHIVAEECSPFNRQVLKNLKNMFEALDQTDSKDDDNFFKDLARLCADILNYNKIERTEL